MDRRATDDDDNDERLCRPIARIVTHLLLLLLVLNDHTLSLVAACIAGRHDHVWGGEVEASLRFVLNSALDGSEWSASRPGHSIPRETVPGIH
jgi:hypothetical protein